MIKSSSMRLWAGLFVLVVFVAGSAVGVAVRPWFAFRPRPVFGPLGPRGGPSPPFTERFLDRIDAEINLSEQQERQLRETFETGRLRFRAIYQETRERFDTEQEQMDGEIRAILTPEQVDTYENEIMRMGPDRRGSRRRNGFRPPRRRGPP